MEDIAKTVKSLGDSGLLLKGVTEAVQDEVKEQKGRFLSMLLGALGATFLRNSLTGRVAIAKSHGRGMNRVGEGDGIVRAGYRNKKCRKNNKRDFYTVSSYV